MFVPNSKLDMHELLYPGRKPVGLVKIDWGHPLTIGLKICVGFNNSYADLVTSSMPTFLNGASIIRNNINVEAAFDAAVEYGETSFEDITIITGFNLNYAENFAQIVGDRGSGGYTFSLRYRTGLQVLLSGGSIGSAQLTADGSFYVGAFTHSRSDNTVNLYKDGVLTDTAVINRSLQSQPIRVGNYSGSGGVLSQDNNYTYVFNRKLNSNEIADLTLNPYQFLIPA